MSAAVINAIDASMLSTAESDELFFGTGYAGLRSGVCRYHLHEQERTP